ELDVCNSQYMTGEDFVFSYIPPYDQIIRITTNNAIGTEIPYPPYHLYNVGLFVTFACPDDTMLGECTAYDEALMGNPSLDNILVLADFTYYIIISTNNYSDMNPITAFDMEIIEIQPYDGGVSDISSPVSGNFLSDQEQVDVTIENFGTEPLSGFDIAFKINNGQPVIETYWDTIEPAASVTYSFTSTADLSAPGTYTITAYTIITGDGNNFNDLFTTEVTNTIPPVGAICATAEVVEELPYIRENMTTDGYGNDYGLLDACNSLNMTGNDYVFEFIPAQDMFITIILSNAQGTFSLLTMNYLGMVGLFVTQGCPDEPDAICIASQEAQEGNPRLDAIALTGGVTYYIVVSTNDLFGQNSSTEFDIEIREALPLDAGVVEFISPVTGYDLTSFESVTISIMNYGAEILCNFPVEYSLQGELPQTEIITDSLFPGQTITHTFQNTADLSIPGETYYFSAYTLLENDMEPDNDIVYTEVTHKIKPEGYNCSVPYLIESLPFYASGLSTQEMGNEYGMTDACNSLYMSGNDFVFEFTPSVNMDVMVTLSDAQGVFNTLLQIYYGNVGVFVTEKCPDDTTATCIASAEALEGNPVIDAVALEGGITYYIIVSTNDLLGQNSYTSFNIDIRQIFDNDVGVIEITSPVSAPLLTNNEAVTVTITNFGLNSVEDLTVAYSIDGAQPVVETISGTISSLDSAGYTFETKADLSEAGKTYNIKVFTLLPDDENPQNDTLAINIEHEPPVGSNCSNPHVIVSLPFVDTALTTAGHVNDFDSTDACQSDFMNRNDYIFRYLPISNQCINIILSNTTPDVGLFVTKRCPDDPDAECIGYIESPEANPSLWCIGLNLWTYYYITVSSSSNPETNFDIRVETGSAGIDNLVTQRIEVFPNPAHNKLYIEYEPLVYESSLEIINIKGQSLYKTTLQNKSKKIKDIDISGYPPGLYLVKIANGNGNFSTKVVFQ
ncbi:MAG: T9SS type A sorting domain-containing protein, partial [Bacteroidia bacterium]|nr:T9SS type A sorting domain-containing protein [Bacteroidia bacterium]